MTTFNDFLGNEVKEGDFIVYMATSWKNTRLDFYKVHSVAPAPTGWNPDGLRIILKGTGKQWKGGKWKRYAYKVRVWSPGNAMLIREDQIPREILDLLEA